MPSSVAVIGAGIAGAAAARVLVEAGHAVRVFDKGRAPGGRASTRWYDQRQFDHGCPMFAARSPEFVQAVERWVKQGVAVAVPADAPAGGERMYSGTPGMGAVAAHLVRGLSVRCGVGPGGGEVWRISRDGVRWRLYDKFETNLEPGFDAVVVATPSQQAATLLAFMPPLAERMKQITMTPTWTLMVEFAGGEAGSGGAGCPGGALSAGSGSPPVINLSSGPLTQIILDSAKRPGPARCAWVAHATEAWTREHLELQAEQAVPLLVAAFRDAAARAEPGSALASVGAGEPTFSKAHRWRYARVAEADPQPFAIDFERRIGACGDIFTAATSEAPPRFGTIESAFLSGMTLGQEMARALREFAQRAQEPAAPAPRPPAAPSVGE